MWQNQNLILLVIWLTGEPSHHILEIDRSRLRLGLSKDGMLRHIFVMIKYYLLFEKIYPSVPAKEYSISFEIFRFSMCNSVNLPNYGSEPSSISPP